MLLCCYSAAMSAVRHNKWHGCLVYGLQCCTGWCPAQPAFDRDWFELLYGISAWCMVCSAVQVGVLHSLLLREISSIIPAWCMIWYSSNLCCQYTGWSLLPVSVAIWNCLPAVRVVSYHSRRGPHRSVGCGVQWCLASCPCCSGCALRV
jgi:hypothetical protein